MSKSQLPTGGRRLPKHERKAAMNLPHAIATETFSRQNTQAEDCVNREIVLIGEQSFTG
jgi:hypothetical protein